MLGEAGLKKLHELIHGFSKEELIWINGYLSGIVNNGAEATGNNEPSVAPKAAIRKINLVFGTETGNSKKLATDLVTIAKKKGISLKLTSLDQYRFQDLEKEEYFFVVISTQGEGEPPAPAKKFYDHIHQQPLSLSNLKFSVLALGDTSYPLYCKTGEDVDLQLHKLGGRRVVPLQKCDVDYEDDARQWFNQVLAILEQTPATVTAPDAKPAVKKPTGKKYYNGTIITNINLNDRGSLKQTNHIEIATDEEIAYEPGDTIGVIPRNRPEVVDRILSLSRANGEEIVETSKVSTGLRVLLLQHLNICFLLSSTVKKYAGITGHNIPDVRMDLVDLLRIYPVKSPQQFTDVVKTLMPIAPRLYSIASSPAAHGNNEVHITVARDRFLAQDEQRFGLCSEFLGDQPVNSSITFYVHKDKSFKLPSPEKDVIMIGPGTGVAPFRAFLSERDATGASGRNWFFFGEQRFRFDFLYQTEIQHFLATGVLTRIDLAFSRDQQYKIYVQHRMLEQASHLYQWINDGAYVYISGTKDPMSKEVETTLLQILAEQGQQSPEAAAAYLDQMKKEGRYEKDVY